MLHYATFGDDGDGAALLRPSEPGTGESPAAQAPMLITLESRPKRLSPPHGAGERRRAGPTR